jgi:hypothetical protein
LLNNGKSAGDGRFQLGNSGRKPGSRNKRTVLMEQLLEGDAEAVAKKVIELAKDGDIHAARIIFDRCYPAPKGRFVEFEMPEMKTASDLVPAYGAIIAAISDGQLTIDEGSTLAGIVELRRKAIETSELEQRIAALETQKGSAR